MIQNNISSVTPGTTPGIVPFKELQTAPPQRRPFRLLTVPKSGTHLIEKILKEFGYNKSGPPHHIFYKVRLAFRNLNPKVGYVAAIRDPRDVMISLVHFVDKIFQYNLRDNFKYGGWTTRNKVLIRKWLNDTSFDQKLMHVINTNPLVGADFKWVLTDQLNEARRLLKIKPLPNNIILVRYEDLVGPKGGGSSKAQKEAIQKMANHLRVKLTDQKMQSILDNVWGGTKTFRKGTIGQWKEVFNAKHIQAFKNNWNACLLDLGYEYDPDWDVPYLEKLNADVEQQSQ